MNLGEAMDLLFCGSGDVDPRECTDGDYKNFKVFSDVAGFEVEVQVQKFITIEARNFELDITGPEEAEAQFEDNLCLRLHTDPPGSGGNLIFTLSTDSDEGGELQFKKFEHGKFDVVEFTDATECGDSPNMIVDGSVTMTVAGLDDGSIQIEEGISILAGGDIIMTGLGGGSQIQIKKDVVLEITDPDLTDFPSDDDPPPRLVPRASLDS